MEDEDEETKSEYAAELKELIAEQIDNVDDEENSALLKRVSQNVDSYLGTESRLGQSLNKNNLLRIIHRVAVGAHKDVDNLRDPNKESGMVVDVDDIEYLVDNVVAEVKKENENNKNRTVDLRQVDNVLRGVTKNLNNTEKKRCFEQLDGLNKSITRLVRDEELTEKVLESSSFRDRLTDMVTKYKAELKETGAHSKPLVEDSNLYKILTT